MRKKTIRLTFLVVLALMLVALVATGCGEEEGREARATADAIGGDVADFAQGFCGAIILVPLAIVVALSRRRSDSG